MFHLNQEKTQMQKCKYCSNKIGKHGSLGMCNKHYIQYKRWGDPFHSDKKKAKYSWDSSKGPNPYISLPKMVLMTYQLPDSIIDIASSGEFNEFDLNTFFYVLI